MTEAEQDTGKGPAGVAQRWIAELDLAEREEAEWRRRGNRVIQRYKDERKNGKGNANAALIDQILDITEEFPRDKARQALTILFTEKNVRTSIEKTWDSEDAYKGITTGA